MEAGTCAAAETARVSEAEADAACVAEAEAARVSEATCAAEAEAACVAEAETALGIYLIPLGATSNAGSPGQSPRGMSGGALTPPTNSL